MNSQHRAIRTLLQTMAPRRAEEYIRSFQLPEEEERFLYTRGHQAPEVQGVQQNRG